LVLDRYRENRSQFVGTTLKGGREGIFWPTSPTARKTRPGMRLPTRRSAAGVLEVVVDSRERYAWKFEQQQVKLSRRAMVVGDYAVEVDGETVGVVERKKLEALAGNVVDGSLLVMLGELATAKRSAIVVEDRWADVFRLTYVAPSMVAETLAAAQVRYPNVPIVFCENRQLAQEWAHRFLGAAAAFADEEAADLALGF
jgi:ERCC4-type nuclease